MPMDKKLRIGVNHLFRKRLGLNEEKPPEITSRKLHVRALVHHGRRRNIQERRRSEKLGGIERKAMPDSSSAIVTDIVKGRKSHPLHQLSQITCHDTLGVRRVLGVTHGFTAIAVSAQIRKNHRVVLGKCRSNFAPNHVVVRMTVNHQERHALPGTRKPNYDAVS